MSYEVWSTNGFGFCVDKIETTLDKVLKLAALNEETLTDLKRYLDYYCEEEGYTYEDLDISDIDEFEGEYGYRGLSTILCEVINQELYVVLADDFHGTDFILYCPSYPWSLKENERNLTEQDVVNIFNKYISILTDEPITIDYYSVENGG